MTIKTIKSLDTPVNPDIEKISKEMNSNYSFDVIDESKDDDEGYYLKQPVNPNIAEYYFDKSGMVASSVEIYAEDVILTNKIVASSEKYDMTALNEMLHNCRLQLSYQYADLKLFGAGCSKIVLFEDNSFTLLQLPQKQIRIRKIKHTDNKYYPIIVQTSPKKGAGHKYKYYKKFDTYYPPELITYKNQPFEGYVTWLGESQFYNYYEKPFWFQSSENIGSKISIETLDRKTFNEGNNANGVFYFNKTGVTGLKKNKPPKPIGEEKTNEEDLLLSTMLPANVEVLKRELKAAGTGTAFLYEQSKEAMLMNYVKISNDNYDYISERIKDIDQGVISRSQIPRERYMLNDVKESMNSQKTQAFWEIYTNKINAVQLTPETMLKNLINFIYGISVEVDIQVPLFSIIKAEKIKMVRELFNDAMLTLRQSLKIILPYLTDLDWEDVNDIDDPILDMRFKNGRGLLEFGGQYPNIRDLGLGDVLGPE